jgi:hypothetical protein
MREREKTERIDEKDDKETNNKETKSSQISKQLFSSLFF